MMQCIMSFDDMKNQREKFFIKKEPCNNKNSFGKKMNQDQNNGMKIFKNFKILSKFDY
jgi:hypothetical protein